MVLFARIQPPCFRVLPLVVFQNTTTVFAQSATTFAEYNHCFARIQRFYTNTNSFYCARIQPLVAFEYNHSAGIWQPWLYLARTTGCTNTTTLLVIGQPLVAFGQTTTYFSPNMLYSLSLVVFGQHCPNTGNQFLYLKKTTLAEYGSTWLHLGIQPLFAGRWLYSGEVVVFEENYVVFRQGKTNFAKSGCTREIARIWATTCCPNGPTTGCFSNATKWLYSGIQSLYA